MTQGKRTLHLVHSQPAPDALQEPPSLAQKPDLASLFREHSRYVAALGTRLLGRENEVDDLVQDVFIRAMRALPQLRDPAAARGWLAAIAVRQAYTRLARRRVLRTLGLDRDYDYEWIAEDTLDERDRAALVDVYRALDGLDPSLRVPWVLRYGQGEQIDGIAELCGCSRATVKRRIEAAQAVLDQELGE
jgi:RNA polymerase sigma-70 factor (ECF subfamily)